MATKVIDTEAEFDAQTKKQHSLGGYTIDTIPDILSLGNRGIDDFKFPMINGSTWKMYTSAIRGYTLDGTTLDCNITSPNKLTITVTPLLATTNCCYLSTIQLLGDFDISVNITCDADINNLCAVGIGIIDVINTDDNYVQIYRYDIDGIEYIGSQRKIGGVYNSVVTANNSINPSFRIKRVGNAISTFYNIGGGWINHLNTNNSNPIYFYCTVGAIVGGSITGQFNTFVNSSTFAIGEQYLTSGELQTHTQWGKKLTEFSVDCIGTSATYTITPKVYSANVLKWTGTPIAIDGIHTFDITDFGDDIYSYKLGFVLSSDGDNTPYIDEISIDTIPGGKSIIPLQLLLGM